jgi:SAM-dependent methyltransferase
MAHVPAASAERIAEAEATLGQVLGKGNSDPWSERRQAARQAARDALEGLGLAANQLVYGELDVDTVARLLAAVEVRDGDRFLDIGSGDGLPTLAAALLYPAALQVCRGIEIVPALAGRAAVHAERLGTLADTESIPIATAAIQLLEGDIYDEAATARADAVRKALADTTLALCFATTWSDAPRRTLARLSTRLHATMPAGARVILVDARLIEQDGWRWDGDLRITTPDTAPYSTARLYTKLGG